MCKLYLPVLAVVVTFQSCSPAKDLDDTISSGKWIDLSYDLSAQTLYWPNNPTNFKLDTTAEGITPGGFYYSTNAFSAPEHGGTHLDAPIHFAQHGLTVDKVDVDRLTGDAVVIDVSANALANRDYLVSTGDIANWEKKYGAIKENSIVLFKTGYGQFYPDAAKYFGTAEKAHLPFPNYIFRVLTLQQRRGWCSTR